MRYICIRQWYRYPNKVAIYPLGFSPSISKDFSCNQSITLRAAPLETILAVHYCISFEFFALLEIYPWIATKMKVDDILSLDISLIHMHSGISGLDHVWLSEWRERLTSAHVCWSGFRAPSMSKARWHDVAVLRMVQTFKVSPDHKMATTNRENVYQLIQHSQQRMLNIVCPLREPCGWQTSSHSVPARQWSRHLVYMMKLHKPRSCGQSQSMTSSPPLSCMPPRVYTDFGFRVIVQPQV